MCIAMASLQYELSYWEQNSFFNEIDTLVVGAGIVGLSAAIRIKELAPNLKVVVAERGPLPIGASTRNAGFACFGSMTELLDDLSERSDEEVWSLVNWRYRGLLRLRARYGDTAIGYQPTGGYELFAPADEASYAACEAAMPYFNAALKDIIGVPDTFVAKPDRISGLGLGQTSHLIFNEAEGQVNTGMLVRTLLSKAQSLGIDVWGGLPIAAYEEHAAGVDIQTEYGWSFKARTILVATNAFAPSLDATLEVIPARNQVLITKPIPGLKLDGCFHYHCGYVYFRNVGNRILLGGARHLDIAGETTDVFGGHAAIEAYLRTYLKEVIAPYADELPIERQWSGIIGRGEAKSPIVKALGARSVAAVRLGGMGVAIGVEVGEQAAELVLQLA